MFSESLMRTNSPDSGMSSPPVVRRGMYLTPTMWIKNKQSYHVRTRPIRFEFIKWVVLCVAALMSAFLLIGFLVNLTVTVR